jgi:hypothetical protein
MMGDRASHWLAWTLWGISVGLSLTGLALLALTPGVPVPDVYGFRGAGALIAVPFSTMGALVASRRPRNSIGWLFSAAGLAIGFGVFGEQYATFSVAEVGSSLPLTEVIAWLQNPMWLPLVLFGLIYPLVLFPDGRPPTPRWRWLLWIAPVTVLGFAVVIAVEPGPLQSVPVRNPYAIDRDTIDLLIPVVGLPFVATAFLSVVAMARRFRRSTGDEHEQLKWFLSAGAITAFALFLNIAVGVAGDRDGTAWQVVAVFTLLSFGMIPIAAGIAVLRYRLYDIEVVISRTLTYSILAGFLTAVYVGVIVGIGALVGRWGGSSVVLPIAATALAAVGFQPVRQRARAFANRLVYGKRTSGYEALTALASGQTLEELSSKVARLATESTAVRRSVVWLSNGLELEPTASWPEDEPMPPPVQLLENESPTFPDGLHTFSLIHQSDLLGAITARTGPGERLSAEDNRLLSDLAAHAAIAFRGLLEAVVLPEGIVTFLMTDVEGSTRLGRRTPRRPRPRCASTTPSFAAACRSTAGSS